MVEIVMSPEEQIRTRATMIAMLKEHRESLTQQLQNPQAPQTKIKTYINYLTATIARLEGEQHATIED